MALTETMIGADIFTQDGERLGKLKEIHGGYFKVDAPMQPDYWLPEQYLGQGTGNEIRVSFTKDRLDDYKVANLEDAGTAETRETTSAYDTRATETRTSPPEGRESVELREEQVQANTRPERAGEVTIGKDVVTEQRHMDVPVTHEEVVVERRPIEGRPTTGDIRESEDISVPVMQERVEVEKQPVVTEEVSLGKRPVTETEHVSTEVRREEPRIEHEGDVRMAGGTGGQQSGWSDVSSQYRQEWQTRYGSSGRWEDYEPGYRYGYEMANDPRYQGRDYTAAENDLHRDYQGWAQRSGYQYDESGWDRIKNNVRDAFNGGRMRRAA